MKRIKEYLVLQLVIMVYSIATIPSKLASKESFLSFKFCLYYGLLIACLALYAILWQQVLKKWTLVIAYASKATTIIWSIVIGCSLFDEEITLMNIIGVVIVIIGIVVMVKGEYSHE